MCRFWPTTVWPSLHNNIVSCLSEDPEDSSRLGVNGGLEGTYAMKKLIAIIAIAVVGLAMTPKSALSAPAWKDKWEKETAEARKEGKVVIYGQVGPELRVALGEAIKKDLGLDLELVPGKGGEVATRFTTEIRAGSPSADILLGGASTFIAVPELYAAWEKLEPLLILPEVVDSKAWPNGKLPFLDSQKKMIPLVLQATQLLVVNTSIVKPGQIKSYRDLLQPQWKGKIVMYDPSGGGTSQTWIQLLLTKIFGLVEGEAFLRKFAAQEPMITRDSRLQIEWVARGRYPVTVGIDSQAVYNMHKTGAPVTRLPAEEGGSLSGGGGYLVVSVKRPHPHAAALVTNWLLSARGQEVYSGSYGAPASRLNIKTTGISQLAYPLPGEKLYLLDEETLLIADKGIEIAKKVFAPLMK